MKCEMCGLDDTNESPEQRLARLGGTAPSGQVIKGCRRCIAFEEGRSAEPRTEAELAGLGQRKQPIHALVQYWLLHAGVKAFADLRETANAASLTDAAVRSAAVCARFRLLPWQADVLLSSPDLVAIAPEQLAPFVEVIRADIGATLTRNGVDAAQVLALRELSAARGAGMKTLADFGVPELAFVLSWVFTGRVKIAPRVGG